MKNWRDMAERVLGVKVSEPTLQFCPPTPQHSKPRYADIADIAQKPATIACLGDPRVGVPLDTNPASTTMLPGPRAPRLPMSRTIAEHLAGLGGHAGILEAYGDLELAHRLWDSHRLWLRDAGTPLATQWETQYRATWHRFVTVRRDQER